MGIIKDWRCNNTNEQRSVWDRTWEKVAVGTTAECWEWMGSKTKFGHGLIMADRRGTQTSAHRVAYQMFFGVVLSREQCVLHKCDNPSCCNPRHLFVGTKGDNNRDTVSKQRHFKQRVTQLFCKRNHRRTESGQCKECRRLRDRKEYRDNPNAYRS